MNILNKYSSYISYLGCIVIIIGSFLPLLLVNKQVYPYNGQLYIIVCAIIGAIFIFLKKPKLSLIPTGIAIAITTYHLIDTVNSPQIQIISNLVEIGYGIYIMGIGILIMIISVFLNKKKNAESYEGTSIDIKQSSLVSEPIISENTSTDWNHQNNITSFDDLPQPQPIMTNNNAYFVTNDTPEQVKPKDEYKPCTKCGMKVKSDASVCYMCGQQL